MPALPIEHDSIQFNLDDAPSIAYYERILKHLKHRREPTCCVCSRREKLDKSLNPANIASRPQGSDQGSVQGSEQMID